MSQIKISELPGITVESSNTSNTLLVGVDIPSDITGRISATSLAAGLYANNILNVGANPVLFSNTIAQFSGSDPQFLQVNQQNFNANGSSDYILTADIGTNSTNYIDLGINNSQFSNVGFTSMYPLDGYLYVQNGTTAGGNLIIGTSSTNTHINFVAGGINQTNIVAKITANSLNLQNSANLIFSDGTVQTTAAASNAYSQAAFTQANLAYTIANTANNLVNYQTGVDATQNANNLLAFSYINSANANIGILYGIETTQNTNIQYSWNLANTAVQNTANILLTGNVTFNGANTFFNSNIVTVGTMTTTGNVVTTGNLTATGPVVFNGNFINNGQTTNNGNTINNGNLTTTGNVISVGYLTANGQSTLNGQTILNGNTTTTGSFIMSNPNFASNSFAIGIIGSSSGQAQMPIADGTMLQITGKDGVNSKVIVDAAGTGVYALYNGRAMRGLANTPSALLSGDIMTKFGGNGYGSTGFGSGVNVGGAYMQYVAAENFSDTTKGTNIVFGTTPTGSNTVITTLTLTSNTATMNGCVVLTDSGVYQYSTSNNSTVTQLTNKSTAVTCNGRTGQITTSNANLPKGTTVTFTVNNNQIVSAKDVVMVNIASGATVGYAVTVTNVTPGSFNITIDNCDGTPSGAAATDTLVINFAIIRVA